MKKGFTIVETTLVLAISGLFAVGMMVGWSININRQRYEDTVNTFKSDIQSIFNEIENPTNPRMNNIACVDNSNNVRINDNGTRSTQNRGATNCILLGKFVMFSSLGQGYFGNMHTHFSENSVTVADVIGKDIDTSKACGGRPCNNSLDALKATNFVIAAGSNSSSGNPIRNIGLEWRANFRNVTDNRNDKITGKSFKHSTFDNGKTMDIIRGMMILRSPIDGSLITFAVPIYEIANDSSYLGTNPAILSEFRNFVLQEGAIMTNGKTINLCIRNEGANSFVGGEMFYGRNKVLRIGANAASVNIDSLDNSSCGIAPAVSSFGDVIIDGNPIR